MIFTVYLKKLLRLIDFRFLLWIIFSPNELKCKNQPETSYFRTIHFHNYIGGCFRSCFSYKNLEPKYITHSNYLIGQRWGQSLEWIILWKVIDRGCQVYCSMYRFNKLKTINLFYNAEEKKIDSPSFYHLFHYGQIFSHLSQDFMMTSFSFNTWYFYFKYRISINKIHLLDDKIQKNTRKIFQNERRVVKDLLFS